MRLLTELGIIEYICCSVCLLMQAGMLAVRRTPAKELLVAVIAMVPASLFTVTAFTRFLSWDESYMFYDLVNYHSSSLPQWEMGVFRTTITLLGPPLKVIETLASLTKDVILVLAKVAHLMTGMLIITILIDQLHQLFFKTIRQGAFHAVAFNALLFLPIVGLALKTLNYDLLSMLLGVLGTLWCIYGLQPINKKMLFAGIVTLTLASHEKMIASPLLWLGLIAVAARCALSGTEDNARRRIILRLGIWSVMVSAAAMLTIGFSFVIVKVTHSSPYPVVSADHLLLSFTSCWWPLRRFLYESVGTIRPAGSVPHEIMETFKGFLSIAAVVFAGSGIALFGKWLIRKKNNHYNLTGAINNVVKLRLALLLLLTVTGVVAGYALDVSIWPLGPIDAGHYIPATTFNGIALHYGASTLPAHAAASAAWACAVFVNALPTVLLILMLTASCMCVASVSQNSATVGRLLLEIFAVICLFAPFAYGFMQIPLYPRYFNLFLLGAVIIIIPGTIRIPYRNSGLFYGVAATGLLLLVAECIPFQPSGAAFRPIWSNYSKFFNTDPSFGKVTPWYPGWGEELLAASDRIRTIPDNCPDGIRLYHNFPAVLIRPPNGIVTSAMPRGLGQLDYNYGDCDYYILSRNGVSSYVDIPFPYEVKPVFTIADRGFIKAWVFRGSDLEIAGFRFNEVH